MFFFNSAARLGRDDGKLNYPSEERGTASFTIYDDVSDVYDNTHGSSLKMVLVSADIS